MLSNCEKRLEIEKELARSGRSCWKAVASDWPASHLEGSENRGRFLPLKDLHGYVVHGNAGNSLAVRGAMVGMAMKNYVSAVTIDHLS